MEHVTNIAYPENALTAETTIAHELSHHWWGDLITCETDRDMWINEGMAVFSEYLFLEDKYSVKQMNEDKEDNLSSVLRFAHIDEGGYQPISGIPRVHTYGDHSYKKGSLVAHNLRKFLGDSLFFRTAKSFLDSFQFKAVNSYDFRDFFSAKSGVDLTHFFNEWVFNGGMPDFQLWSWESQANTGLYKNSVVIKQNKAGNPALFTKVPLKIRFYAANGNSWVEKVLVSKDSESFQFQSPQKAVSVELNPDYDLSYAVTKAYDTLTTDGAANKSNLFLSWSVSKVQDTTRIWGETHWAKPFISIENQVELGVRVNLGRYWNFSSQDNADSLQISFSSFINAEEGQTDTGLIKYSLDSLVLLHRATGGEWKMVETGVTIHGIPNGKRGGFTLNNGKLGEYVLAEKDPAINDTLLLVENTFNEESPVSVYPNPSGGKLVFFNHNQWNRGEFIILNLKGEEVLHESIPNMGKEFSCDISRQPSGVYFYVINSGTDRYYGRIVKK
jgi:aminopeptidase N